MQQHTTSSLVGPSIVRTSGLVGNVPHDQASQGSAKLHTYKSNSNKHPHPSQRHIQSSKIRRASAILASLPSHMYNLGYDNGVPRLAQEDLSLTNAQLKSALYGRIFVTRYLSEVSRATFL